MEQIIEKITDKNNNKNSFSFKEEKKKKLNKLLNDVEFIENNNYLLRLLKKSDMLPNKYDLLLREKNPISLNNEDIKDKKELYDNNEENIPHIKSKLQLTYEIDDILYNHSKSFSKSKKRYYKIKKENDEFLAFYRYNKRNKFDSAKINKRFNTLSSKKRYKNIMNENNKIYDVFNTDNYLIMNNPKDIYYHFLYQTSNDRKFYTQQKPYKYITKMKRLLKNKSYEEKNEDSNSDQNKRDNNYNNEKYNKTVTNFFNIQDKINNVKIKVKPKISLKNNIIEPKFKNKVNNSIKNIRNNIITNKIKNSTLNNNKQMKNKINLDITNKENDKNKINSKINNIIYFPINENKNIKNINIKKSINKINPQNVPNILDNLEDGNITLINKNQNIKINKENSISINSFNSNSNSKSGKINDNILINNQKKKEINKNKENDNLIIKNKELIDNKIHNESIKNNSYNSLEKYNTKNIKSKRKSQIKSNINPTNNLSDKFIKNTIQIIEKGNKIKLENNKKESIIKINKIYQKKSSVSNIKDDYYSNLNKYTVINDKNNSIENKEISEQKIINIKTNSNQNNSKIFKNSYGNNSNKSLRESNQKILIYDKHKSLEKNNMNITNNLVRVRNSIYSKRNKTIFGLYEEQKNKLNKKFTQNNYLNMRKRKTYDQLEFYDLDIFNKKRDKNKSSFITGTNNYSNISNKKYILNYYKGQNLESLIDNIKMATDKKKLYRFLKNELFKSEKLKLMENEYKYLTNLDKHFIKKYSEFQVLISYADDNS